MKGLQPRACPHKKKHQLSLWIFIIYFYRYYLYNERYGGKMMDEYRDNQVKKLMMKRRKKKRIKVIRLFFVLGIIGFVFFYFIV